MIRAAHTVTFIALKPGLLTGQMHYDDLGLGEWLDRETPLMAQLSAELLPRGLSPCDPYVHKSDNGRLLLIVGGDHRFAGAICMTGEAALRCGAGLIRVLSREENIPSLLTARPELMMTPLMKAGGKNAPRAVEHCDKPML